jgi:hypothetical protein
MHFKMEHDFKAALKSGRPLEVRVSAGAHASLRAGMSDWYPLVHFTAKSGGLLWVVNPDTDHVCRVSLEDTHLFRYGGDKDAPAAVNLPAHMYVIASEDATQFDNSEEATQLAEQFARNNPDRVYHVACITASVKWDTAPRLEIKEH